MVRREVLGRYRGSLLGLAWSFFNPLLMLGVYTFVFSTIFKSRWADPAQEQASQVPAALILFAGLIVNGFFSEVLGRASTLIVGNVNYVKKVVFPLELLPVVAVVSGREASIAQVTSSAVSVYGNATPYKIYFGIKYDMTYQFSPIYLRNQNIPVLDGRVTLTYGSISYSDTGYFKVAVDVRYRNSTSYTYFGGSLDASYSTDAVNLDKGSFRFPIHGRNEDATVTVSSNSHFPIRLNAASFEAQYVTRTR
jgi:hypothetical protein